MKTVTRRRRARRLTLVTLVAAGVLAAGLGRAEAAAPTTAAHDYLATKGLSAPAYDYETQMVRETLKLVMADREGVYLEITRPKDDLRHPVIFGPAPTTAHWLIARARASCPSLVTATPSRSGSPGTSCLVATPS